MTDTHARPNVIIILTDDQGYGDLSCHGHPLLHTPNIDRLHDQSVRFTDFHVTPMCAPSRGELMSGVDCLRNGAMATSLGRHLLRQEYPTVADLFSGAGYSTGIFGKWHLGDSYPYRPMDRGFDEAVYHLGFGLTGADDYWNNDYFDPWYRHNGELKRANGYCTDFWFEQATSWMVDRKQAGEAFLCYLPTNVPHFPMWVDDVYKEEFAAHGDDPAGFFGMIQELDENVERLEAFLVEQELHDNTIVIYMTDNGHAGGARDIYNAGMRGGKCARYDGGHRVPCFMRWPEGRLGEPRDVATPTQVQDILPTLLELCGVEPPDILTLDGSSLVPLLRETPHGLDDRMFVVQYFQNSLEKDDACVIWKQWRLVYGKELYDIHADPGQEHDISGEHPDVVETLKTFYNTWWSGVEPRVHEFSPLHVGSEHEPIVTLTCCEWENVRCDGIGSVRAGLGGPQGGPWNVNVETAGTYEIELRRWPRESGLPLAAPAPEFHAAVDVVEAGVAIPVASAVLKAGDALLTRATPDGAEAALFRAELPQGRTQLHGWFRDAQGNDVCGAYYAYVQRA